MTFKKFISEDDAVSPVIGVILMVAITVILAAVIASFVLGLGGDSDVQPNTALSFDYSPTDEELTVTVTSGDSLDPNEVYLRGEIGDGSDETVDVNEDLASILDNEQINSTAAAGASDENLFVTSTGGLDFDEEEEFEGGVEEEISSGQGLVFIINEDTGSLESLNETSFDVVWDTGDDSATLDGFDGPDA